MNMSQENKLILSPSKIVKFLFGDAYKDIPEWILEKAAEFGKDMHQAIQCYIEDNDNDDLVLDSLTSDKQVRLYETFKEWYSTAGIVKPQCEYKVSKELRDCVLEGYIDLIDLESNKFYDYKFRNVDNKLDITKDIIQMICYAKMLNYEYDWELLVFDKKTAKLFKFTNTIINPNDYQELNEMIDLAISILSRKQNIKPITKIELKEVLNGRK